MRFAWRWAPVLAQMGAIFYASSMTAVPDLPGGLTDKTGHLIGYALLSMLAIRGFAGATWSGITTGAAIRAVLFSSVYGMTDEFHQRFVANRTPDVMDWLADTVGALLGVVIVLVAARLRRRRG